jgi:ubiquinone/menaquinone biosynthesis C-methylase UbiE
MPDIVTSGDDDHYIGYEYIADAYSGNRKYLVEDRDLDVAKFISDLSDDGVLLDLACGDGCITVPCASLGMEVIAGDISNTMLNILCKKAEYNDISLEKVHICRMNALDIPLADESVDSVIANSVLHLISNPQKVIREIHRVLKKGGKFICLDDVPGKVLNTPYDNSTYLSAVNDFYSTYWSELAENGVKPKKYSWKFDRDAYCTSIFRKETYLIERNAEYSCQMKDEFLPRIAARGFSDQVNVPTESHKKAIEKTMQMMYQKYGRQFDELTLHGHEDDIFVTIYEK